MKIFIILLCICKYVSTMEASFEKIETEYYNPKYFRIFTWTLRRASRRSPYMLNLYQEYMTGLGNNVTIKIIVYEVISGRHILTPVQLEYRLCDFLYKDIYLGKMFSDQLPRNWKCPFSAGYQNWTNIALHFEYAPYIPFTYSSLSVKVCADVQGFINGETGYKVKIFAGISQKLADVKSKKKLGIV